MQVPLLLRSSMSFAFPKLASKYFTHAFFQRDLSKIAPRNIYSSTRGPLPSIVTDTVADAILKLVVSSIAERRDFASLKAAPRDRVTWRLTFMISERPFRRKKRSLRLTAAMPVTRYSMDNFSSHLLLRFLLILLFLFYQSLQKPN